MSKQDRLTRQINELAREKTPQRDLWQGVEHAITQGSTKVETNWRPQLAIAASLLLVVLVGYMGYQSGINTQSSIIAEQMSEQYLKQREELLVSFQDKPATTENWQQQLDDLDRAAAAIKSALQEDPKNPALLHMLKQVYEQQLKLIERVHAPSWQKI
ncbi:hypothetical protein [Glaciecola sp. 1036]|uniref:hypothetical protein n=1 Tax=Alteromonadaceae TaxID=72275 RepID=UPI003D069145